MFDKQQRNFNAGQRQLLRNLQSIIQLDHGGREVKAQQQKDQDPAETCERSDVTEQLMFSCSSDH